MTRIERFNSVKSGFNFFTSWNAYTYYTAFLFTWKKEKSWWMHGDRLHSWVYFFNISNFKNFFKNTTSGCKDITHYISLIGCTFSLFKLPQLPKSRFNILQSNHDYQGIGIFNIYHISRFMLQLFKGCKLLLKKTIKVVNYFFKN